MFGTEQETKTVEEMVARWQGVALSSEPTDRPKAEEFIQRAYWSAQLAHPQHVIWCGSPLAAALARGICLKFQKAPEGEAEKAMAGMRAMITGERELRVWDQMAQVAAQSLALCQALPYGAGAETSVLIQKEMDAKWYLDEKKGSALERKWLKEVTLPVQWPVIDAARVILNALGGNNGVHLLDSFPSRLDGAEMLFDHLVWDIFCGMTGQDVLEDPLLFDGSCGGIMPHEAVCWVYEKPCQISLDHEGRLHSGEGMAVQYPDGWGLYAWHGVKVAEKVLLRPETITLAEIEKEENAEIRRVMVEFYGYDRYFVDSGAQEIDRVEEAQFMTVETIEDLEVFGLQGAKLYRKEVKNEEPLVMVALKNSTPEPDGSIKKYFLRVPPFMKSVRKAVAWTFGLKEGAYTPVMET